MVLVHVLMMTILEVVRKLHVLWLMSLLVNQVQTVDVILSFKHSSILIQILHHCIQVLEVIDVKAG